MFRLVKPACLVDRSVLRLTPQDTASAGLKVGREEGSGCLLHHADHVLLDKEGLWPALQPDVVLQLGGRLTSKRTAQFLEWSSSARPDQAGCANFWVLVYMATDFHQDVGSIYLFVQACKQLDISGTDVD